MFIASILVVKLNYFSTKVCALKFRANINCSLVIHQTRPIIHDVQYLLNDLIIALTKICTLFLEGPMLQSTL